MRRSGSAIWLNDLSRLRDLKKAMANGLALTQDTPYGGVAHHQVDVHLFDFASGEYRGRLCSFGQCPKQGKRECLVPGCGAQPFLRQFEDYRFKPARFAAEPKVVLFDRSAKFLCAPPKILELLGIQGQLVPLSDEFDDDSHSDPA